jgi:hypothetical protein
MKQVKRATAQNVQGNLPSAKQVKADAKAKAKAETQAVKDARRSTVDMWNEDNRSISGLSKWAKTAIGVEKQKLTEFTSAVNVKYGTQITPATINAKLLKFGYIHELNKVDDKYNVLEQKRLFSINFMLTLIERRAKIKGSEAEFVKLQKKAKANFIDRVEAKKERERLEESFQAYAVATIEALQS